MLFKSVALTSPEPRQNSIALERGVPNNRESHCLAWQGSMCCERYHENGQSSNSWDIMIRTALELNMFQGHTYGRTTGYFAYSKRFKCVCIKIRKQVHPGKILFEIRL